jgi:drug/metabolite transporter (DMT)-like permease
MRISNAGLFMIASAIWGSTWLAITFQLGSVAPELSVAYRFTLASLMVGAWCVASRRSLSFRRRQHLWLLGMGATFFGFNYIGIYWAERYVASGLVAVVFSTIVFMSPIGMRVFYGERLTVRTLVAAALGVSGVALLFLPELSAAREGGSAALGIAVALVATVLATFGNLIAVRNHRARLPTLPVTAWGMLYGALISFAVAALTGVPWTFEHTPAYVLSLAYLALFGSVFAFAAYLTLLERVGAGPSSFVGIATPVIALMLSTFFEGYRWTWVGVVGLALAVWGNWLALRGKR